jgi:hypothetical protein
MFVRNEKTLPGWTVISLNGGGHEGGMLTGRQYRINFFVFFLLSHHGIPILKKHNSPQGKGLMM